MTLQVIGTGLGRSGTSSLKLALEQLGLGPCHHMTEVFAHTETVPLWNAAGEGRPDWAAIFAGYASAVDYPAAAFWREITAHYPAAKVIHTVRDPGAWFESTQATIFAPTSMAREAPPAFKTFFAHVTAAFGKHIADRAFMIEAFERHTREVLETIAPERLLVFEAAMGWAPLCAFLGLPTPDTAFPAVNSRAEFQSQRRTREQPGAASP